MYTFKPPLYVILLWSPIFAKSGVMWCRCVYVSYVTFIRSICGTPTANVLHYTYTQGVRNVSDRNQIKNKKKTVL